MTAPPADRADPLPGLAEAGALLGSRRRLLPSWLGREDALHARPPVDEERGAEQVAEQVPVQVHARVAFLGPAHREPDGRVACSTCVARRWQSVRPEPLRTALEGGVGAARAASPAPWRNPFAELLVAALGTAAETGPTRRHAVVREVDLERLLTTRHGVVADPECPRCGNLPGDRPIRPRLVPVPKSGPADFRPRAGRDERVDLAHDVDPFANPSCGALGPSVVRDVTSTTTAATAGCLLAGTGDDRRDLSWGGHEDRYADSVRVGIVEGLERVAGMRPRARTTAVVAAYDELDDQVLDPRTVGLYGEAVHRADPGLPRFDPGRPIRWVWGHSLRDDQPILVPEVLAYYHLPGARPFVQESSNGCASGASDVEAALFGLLEVVERDAFLLGWYAGRALPEIDPRSSARPATRAMVARLAECGYRARFFDARVTFPIPVVIGVAERVDGGIGRLCFGAGASPDPETALGSALREIATDAPHSAVRTRRHEQRLRALAADLSRVRFLHDHALLYGLPQMRHHADFLLAEGEARSVRDLFEVERPRPQPATDLLDDLRTCVDLVAGAGSDVVVVDQTMRVQRELGLRTVKVIAPGLLPLDFGWERQRALRRDRLLTARYDAGLDPTPLTPDRLTPAPHPLP